MRKAIPPTLLAWALTLTPGFASNLWNGLNPWAGPGGALAILVKPEGLGLPDYTGAIQWDGGRVVHIQALAKVQALHWLEKENFEMEGALALKGRFFRIEAGAVLKNERALPTTAWALRLPWVELAAAARWADPTPESFLDLHLCPRGPLGLRVSVTDLAATPYVTLGLRLSRGALAIEAGVCPVRQFFTLGFELHTGALRLGYALQSHQALGESHGAVMALQKAETP